MTWVLRSLLRSCERGIQAAEDFKFLVSDRIGSFICKLLAKVCKLHRIDQRTSTALHPQKDGQTERANRTLEGMCWHLINPAQNDWDVKLPWYKFAVNDARNVAAGSTLFFLNHGDHLRTSVHVKIVTPLPAANSFVGTVSAAVSSEHDLLNAQRCMSKNADQAMHDAQLGVGEYVLLSIIMSVCGHGKAAEQVSGTN